MLKTQLKVGRALYMDGGFISVGFYQANGETALRIVSDQDEPLAMATVCLASVKQQVPVAFPEHVWLKGWGENEGIPEALEDAGLVELTGMKCPTGFSEAVLARVLEPLAAEIARAALEQEENGRAA